MSVRFQRVAQGTGVESIQWAQEVAAYITEKYPKNPHRVYTERYGDPSKVYTVSDWDDVAALDASFDALQADEGFLALLVKAQQSGLFVPGSIHDTILVSA